jgi:excisionase family DNA binding protein
MNPGRKFLTVKQLEELTNVPASWWYVRVERNEVPHYRFGKHVRFDEAQIQEWRETQLRRGPRV